MNRRLRNARAAEARLLALKAQAFARQAVGVAPVHGPNVAIEEVRPASVEELLGLARALAEDAAGIASSLEVLLAEEDENALRFHECFRCSGKPGAPTLCKDCLERRRRLGDRWRGPMPPAMRERIKSRAGRAFAELRVSRGFAP